MTKKPDQDLTAESVAKADLGRSHLLAILFVDACGFSRVMRNNEDAALRSIGCDMSAIRQLVLKFNGALCSFRGDGLLATFGSARDAVRCALAIQKRVPVAEGLLSIQFRVGVHIGDTFSVEGQILGDSVNVAARIESLAEPGGILVSRPVYEALRGPSDIRFESVGWPYLKNIGEDLELFQVMQLSDPSRTQQFDLRLMGRFAMFGPDGAEIAVPHEGKALLAAVALSQDDGCSRQWLQNTIWDVRSEAERAASLEAALSNLRGALGQAFTDVLRVDEARIMLVSGAVLCDVTRVAKQRWSETGPLPDLLEDYDIEGAAFKAWLLRQRSLLRSAICLRAFEPQVAPTPVVTSCHIEVSRPPLTPFAIGLLPVRADGDNVKARFIADLLADWLVRSLSEIEALEIHDYRDGSGNSLVGPNAPRSAGPDLMIQCRAGSAGEMIQIAVTALRAEDRKLIWSQSVIADQGEFLGLAGESVAAFVGYATDALLSALASGRHMRDPAAHHAAKTAIGAVHRLLTMTGPGLDRVEADIMAAYEADPKPVYLAWLAYMTTFHVGERYGVRDTAFEERARALARRALEADPHNALVLGLVAHVHSYIFREFPFAEDLISRALETNPFRSITWDTASLLYSYTGRAGEAMRAAQNARRLGRHSPYRHLFDGACCVAAMVNGRFEEAVTYGESVMAVQPEFKAVLRYLAASYGHLGDSARARTIMRKLMQLEPDLSIERLRDGSYPVPSKESAKLIELGLSRIGLQRHP